MLRTTRPPIPNASRCQSCRKVRPERLRSPTTTGVTMAAVAARAIASRAMPLPRSPTYICPNPGTSDHVAAVPLDFQGTARAAGISPARSDTGFKRTNSSKASSPDARGRPAAPTLRYAHPRLGQANRFLTPEPAVLNPCQHDDDCIEDRQCDHREGRRHEVPIHLIDAERRKDSD